MKGWSDVFGEYHVECTRGAGTVRWRLEVWAANWCEAFERCRQAGYVPLAVIHSPTH